MPFTAGDHVQVSTLGKAIVREVRKAGRYLVELKGRTILVTEAQLAPVAAPRRRKPEAGGPGPAVAGPTRTHARDSIDLHGLSAADAVSALDAFLSDAMLASLGEVRIVHGRGGGRLQAAVHERLRQLGSVRAFRVDPANPGVTVVRL
jgi:DNA mismatch repair protein MutS2